MPNWDRVCTCCGFLGSYLDFDPPTEDPADQRCRREAGCGQTVEWEEEDNEDDDALDQPTPATNSRTAGRG
jgi:hypothetical protein